MTTTQPGQEQRMDTHEQCRRFGCDLIDLLRREGEHSGVWFGDRLLQAADELEKATRPTADLGEDGELARLVRKWDETGEFDTTELYLLTAAIVGAARAVLSRSGG